MLLEWESFVCFIKKSEHYSVFIKLLDGSILRENVPKAESTGVIMNVINPNTNHINITLKSNEETIKNLDGNEFRVHIHNAKSYLSRNIRFKKGKGTYRFLISNKKLSPGVNIVTLFNQENKPVCERIIFIYNNNMFPKISVLTTKTSKDSISINLKKVSDDIHFLSASFLPEITKAYKPENNIYSKFLLKPYIKGHIQNPSYYFNNTNRKKLAALDILLMNQGWSKFSWKNIFHSPPKPIYKIQKGITISGELIIPPKRRNGILSLISPINNLAFSKDSLQKEFKFTNLFLTDTSTITLSYRTPRGKEKKPSGFVRFSPIKTTEVINPKVIEIFENVEDVTQVSLDNFISKREVLDEITIKAKVETEEKPINRGAFTRSIEINESYNPSLDMISFINFNGFEATVNVYRQVSIVDRRTKKVAGLVIDDINFSSRLHEVLNYRIEDIKSYHIKQFAGASVIYLYTRKKSLSIISPTKKDYIVPFGYAIEKEYYQPQYGSNSDNAFKHYGAIFWAPSITLQESEKEHFIKIPTLNQESIRVFIEGITNKGKLISVEKVINIK